MADTLSAKVEGLSSVAKAVEEQLGDIAQRCRVAMVSEAAAIAGDAVLRCPVQTGELRESVFIQPTQDGAEVGFSAPHALYVHERLDLEHDEGEAKFLEHAANAVRSTMAQKLAGKVG
jgi:hypothetical protein